MARSRDDKIEVSFKMSDIHFRLNEWKRELQNRDYLRRKSAVAEFLVTPENLQVRRNSSCVPPQPPPGGATVPQRMYRAHSQQGPERLELPIVTQGRIQRAYSHQGDVPIVLPTNSGSAHGSQKLIGNFKPEIKGRIQVKGS